MQGEKHIKKEKCSLVFSVLFSPTPRSYVFILWRSKLFWM